eukprot:SAG31_NODE_6343_length_2056_cov_1.130301_2_plen_177_part_00
MHIVFSSSLQCYAAVCVQAAAGPLVALPFMEGQRTGWTVARVAGCLRLYIPALLNALAPRMTIRASDIVKIVAQKMWSPTVRAELGPHTNSTFPCPTPTEADAARVERSLVIALERFHLFSDDVLPTFLVTHIDLIQGYLDERTQNGILFLEQCVLGTAMEGVDVDLDSKQAPIHS